VALVSEAARRSVLALVAAACLGGVATSDSGAPNTLSQDERAQGFELLFDGVSTRGWRGLREERIAGDRWKVEKGVLSALAPPPGEAERNDDIITLRSISSFELRAEFRLSPGANSGIKYFLRKDAAADSGQSSVGHEYQILDDAGHPDAKAGIAGNRTLASLYDILPARADKPRRPVGEWNEAKIVVRGRHVEHWLNGAKVLEFERGSDDFKAHLATSKHKVWPGYGEEKEGRILLQHHGGGVSYRSIRIRAQIPE
jgi:hypothetical protein